MDQDRLPWIIIACLLIVMVLLSLSTCQNIKSREQDWKQWKEEAEEYGYQRGYDDGYDAGYADAETDRDVLDTYRKGVLDGWDEGYSAGYDDGARG